MWGFFYFPILNKISENQFKLIYLLGADDLEINKKDEFIIYQGSHGDKSAQIADVILPGSTYTEKNGHYINLEGRIQKAFKATYPPGDSKEDWLIIKELSEHLGKNININSQKELEKEMLNSKSIFLKNGEIIKSKIDFDNNKEISFVNSKVDIDFVDYYFSNHIARSSKTMSECRSIKKNNLSISKEG